MTIQVHTPTGTPGLGSDALAPRPADLVGRRIGLLHNGKTPGAQILQAILERLVADGAVEGERVHKRKSGAKGDLEQLAELARTSDVVVNALADCGGCTSWSVHDAIQVERHGVPTVTVVGESFEGLFHTAARSFEMPELIGVVTPYPVAPDATDEVAIKARVDDLMPAVVAALTAPL